MDRILQTLFITTATLAALAYLAVGIANTVETLNGAP